MITELIISMMAGLGLVLAVLFAVHLYDDKYGKTISMMWWLLIGPLTCMAATGMIVLTHHQLQCDCTQ